MNGVFALAFYDETEESLYLFRDRIGVKPLFYTRQGDTNFFCIGDRDAISQFGRETGTGLEGIK